MDAAACSTLNEIYSLIWNGKFAEATTRLEPLLKKHPVYNLLYCEIAVAIFLLSDKKENYTIASKRLATIPIPDINKRLQKAYMSSYKQGSEEIKVDFENLPTVNCEGELTNEAGINLKHVSSGLWARAILAELAFMDSAIKFRQQKYLKGVMDFKKSWNQFKECDDMLAKLFSSEQALNEIPQLPQIRCAVDFGVGIYQFMCSVVPRHFQFIVEGIGFKADRSVAMEQLKRSMRCETALRSHFSALALGWIYAFFYYNYDVSNQILDLETDKAPESGLILFTSAYVLRKQGKIQESSEAFTTAKTSMSEVPEFQLKIDYELGSNHFMLLEWNQAVGFFTRFLDNYNAEAFRTYCAYQTAFCYLMLGDETKATEYMKKVQPWVRKNFALDEYAGHQAKKFLKKNSFSQFEILYQQALVAHEACNYDSVLNILDKAKSEIKTAGDSGRCSQLCGSALAHLKRYEDAKASYTEVTNAAKEVSKSGNDMYALPFSYCGLTEIAIVEKDAAAAQTNLKKAKGFSSYEFETFLSWRLRKCEDDVRSLK